MIRVILVAPEIPPNTGNIIRLATNTGAELHLVRPLGFRLDDREMRRAGMDYRERAVFRIHDNFSDAKAAVGGGAMFAFSATGKHPHTRPQYQSDDILVFGCESVGLPPEILSEFPAERVLRIPMRAGNRSLNLSNAVAVAVMEAWRQLGFPGAE